MNKFMLVAAIASLSIANPGFVRAQAAIQEPGAYAFYHPDGDVLRAESFGAVGVRNTMAAVAGPTRAHKHGRVQ
jgi:hypothetical protein